LLGGGVDGDCPKKIGLAREQLGTEKDTRKPLVQARWKGRGRKKYTAVQKKQNWRRAHTNRKT